MKPEDLNSVVADEVARINVDEAWTKLIPRIRAGRRRGRLMLAVPVVVAVGLGAALVSLASSNDDRKDVIAAGPTETTERDREVPSTTAASSSTEGRSSTTTATSTPSTTSPAPPPVPVEATFGAFVDRAGRTSDGRITLPVVSVDGHEVQFTMTDEVARLLSPLRISWHTDIICGATAECGSSVTAATTWPEPVLRGEELIRTYRSSDGPEVLLVDGTPAGRVLRWVLPGGHFEVPVSRIPESAYLTWVNGLHPAVDEHGWLTVAPSPPFTIPDPAGGGNGSSSAYFFATGRGPWPIGDLTIVQSPGCTSEDGGENALPRPDGTPNLVLGQCMPEAGVVITVEGEPGAVGTVQEGLTVD